MADRDLINNITTLIDSMVDNVTRSQERMETTQKDVYEKLERLRDDLATLAQKDAIDANELTALKDRLQDLEERFKNKSDWTTVQLSDLAEQLDAACEWIAIEKDRQIQVEKQEVKNYRTKMVELLGRVVTLAGAGAAGGALTKLLSAFFGG